MVHTVAQQDGLNQTSTNKGPSTTEPCLSMTKNPIGTNPKPVINIPTPIRPNVLARFLEGYDPQKTQHLVKGFTEGFSLGVTGQLFPAIYSNHPSVYTHSNFVQEKINKELRLGQYKCPYTVPSLSNFVCSPLGVVPKKTQNEFRIIHDLSYSKHGYSVNELIPPENSTVSLETFDHVAALVLKCGANCYVSKADIQESFRILPISPLDYHKLGFSFDGHFYFDRVLPMGASSSVQLFESFSSSLQWILQNKLNVHMVSHIIDDFISVNRLKSTCQASLTTFLNLCSDINIPIKHEKTCYPSQKAIVHGIEIDTCTLTAYLPGDKVSTLRRLLESAKRKKKIMLKDLQSLLGTLNFACKVIKPGRCFLRRLYDLTKGTTKPTHYIKLTKETRADLALWSNFLDKYNGCTLLTNDRFISSAQLNLYTDAAGTKGFGITHETSWAYGIFSTKVRKLHINILELYPIAVAVMLFGKQWSNKNILFVCDNLAIVYCLQKQTSKDPIIMKLIRLIVLQSLEHNFCFTSKHIPSKENSVCDKLSRFQIEEALVEAPYLQNRPLHIPDDLSPDALLL
ncbi:uncharacterized protein LOC128547809 [Mercenaria mercenaria]|uniref:uncharacterized protein LOC128547809 n=1 Tax=Mercenaria mercenaria TaxID=6596 RepID=UPI00234E6AC4|nr:uncharacterized protein LOC128547809 [Mercenaria mercenaria]